jgi:ankyrin repeat protein
MSVVESVLLPHQDRININYMYEDNYVGHFFGTGLHIALRSERYNDLIPLLCSFRNIDMNSMHPEHDSPLFCCLHFENIEAVRLLLAYKDRINVNLMNANGETALTMACRKGYFDFVQTLLSFPNIDINMLDKYQRTPLHAAMYTKSEKIVQLLVQDPSKCNVNVQDTYGDSPLHLAIRKVGSTEEDKQHQYEIVRILAALPTIDFNLQNNENETVVDVAMRYGNQTIVNEFVKYKDRFDLSLRQKYNL